MKSDKDYWHGYISEYERLVFTHLTNPQNILEYGVGAGASTLFLSERFPTAKIVGVDITCQRPEWPVKDSIEYLRADQGDKNELLSTFHYLNRSFDLIIDDGSHKPKDQASCLISSLPWITSKGFYILEDIHTSFPKYCEIVNAFHLLLAIQHLKKINQELNSKVIAQLTTNSYFSEEDIHLVFRSIEMIHLYRRTSLPQWCYYCGRNDFDYVSLLCPCGAPLYSETDSMSFILRKNT